jgi:C_GCAxxG_C_C family probable redox protein
MKNNRAREAQEIMANRKMNCSQAVLSAFCEEYGLERNLALPVAQGFGGGMGHTGQTCGAVTGAYMVLGLAHKGTPENPRAGIDKTYAMIEEFSRQFKLLHGSLNCTELIGYDLGVPEKLAEARDKKVFSTICPDFVRDAVKMVESLLQSK